MTHMEPDGAPTDLHSHFGQRPTMTSSLRPHKTRSGRTKYHTRLPQLSRLPSVLISGIRVRPTNLYSSTVGMRRPSVMYLIITRHHL